MNEGNINSTAGLSEIVIDFEIYDEYVLPEPDPEYEIGTVDSSLPTQPTASRLQQEPSSYG